MPLVYLLFSFFCNRQAHCMSSHFKLRAFEIQLHGTGWICHCRLMVRFLYLNLHKHDLASTLCKLAHPAQCTRLTELRSQTYIKVIIADQIWIKIMLLHISCLKCFQKHILMDCSAVIQVSLRLFSFSLSYFSSFFPLHLHLIFIWIEGPKIQGCVL